MRPASNDYFFFFFPVFLAFFAFFAFFAMLPSVIPKVGSMQVDIDMHRCRVHHICKIYSSSFEEGKRRSRHRDEGGSTRILRRALAAPLAFALQRLAHLLELLQRCLVGSRKLQAER